MSSSNEKKTGKARARAVAAWEWFKEAAWLQVLLIVGVVVGIVVSIPYVVKGISSAINNNTSTFYDEHRIDYKKFNSYLDGSDTSCNGYMGDYTMTDDNKINFNNDKQGFVVMMYKSNCDSCNTLQKNLENCYKNFNKKYGEGKIKFYTIDVSWDIDDDDKAATNSGKYDYYNNSYITLEQQMDVQFAVKDTYLDQDDTHKSSAVTEDTLNNDLTADTTGGTLPTPMIITFIKDKEAKNYITETTAYEADAEKTNIIQYCKPAQVIMGPLSGLSFSSAINVSTMMHDVYHFELYKGTK